MELLLFSFRIISAVALLAFAGMLGWFMWRDLRATSALLENSADNRASLVIINTEEATHELGSRHPLRPVTGIGRGATNAIVVSDEFASGKHALIARRGNQWWLEDLNSSNGTLLNGAEIERPAVITAGDVITIGSTEYRLEL